jgi:hypothetical protein
MGTIQRTVDAAIMAKMEPYVMALGKVAHSWNYLQEALGQLFYIVTGLEDRMGEALWHSMPSDRMQRQMLRAAAEASNLPKAKGDIKWLLGKAEDVC